MDLLEDPTFRHKYQKHKLKVKRWENEFKAKYARKPNKDDIRAADEAIRESYKMYYKLKTQALEETLLDITFPDESRANISANTSGGADASWSSQLDSSSPDTAPVLAKNSENVDPEMSLLESSHSTISTTAGTKNEETPNVDGAFGSHLNKDKEVAASSRVAKKSNLSIGRSSSFQLSRKLFSSSNLTKRNPRKSLSMNKIKSAKSDLEESGVSGESLNHESADGFDPNESNLFGDTLKVVSQDSSKATAQPTNAIDRLIKGFATTNHQVNYAWLERCTREEKQLPSAAVIHDRDRFSGTSDSGIESNTSDPPTSLDVGGDAQLGEADQTDSEDFICRSDSEEEKDKGKRLADKNEQRNKRARNFDDESVPESNALSPLSKRRCLVRVESFTNRVPTVAATEAVAIATDRSTVADGTKVAEKEEDSATKGTSKGRKKRQPKKTTTTTTTTTTMKRSARPRKTTAKKSVAGTESKRVTRRKTRTKQEPSKEEDDDDDIEDEVEDSEQDPNIAIYGVEAVEQLVPRFAMPESTSGDLVEDFSRSVESSIPSVEPIVGNCRSGNGLVDSGSNKATSVAREKLEKKIASGTVNENFVRINLKKKVFVRGKKNFNSSKYRKNQWKQRKKELSSSEGALDLADLAEKSGGACFKCGETGHFANRCTAARSDNLLAIEQVPEEASKFLTLEQVEKMAKKEALAAHSARVDRLPKCPRSFENESDVEEGEEEEEAVNFEGHKIPEELLAKLGWSQGVKGVGGRSDEAVEPLFPAGPDGSLVQTPDEVFEALRMFGHENFRAGQEKAVMRILSGQSTLVTLSTGSGKSLCYQLPAYLYSKRSRCVTLVVSPLVSLMDDQVTGVPKFLSAAAYHAGQTPRVREQIAQRIKDGELDILLVSPEAVVAGDKSNGLSSLFRQLGPIAFACIDEAHCISQWSHNFRPSYLMLCRVLVEKLGIKTILGLTATATKATASSIVRHLSIHDGMEGVISDIPMPKNLTLTVSRDEQRDRALVDLLLSPRFTECDSIIVYCTRREECTRIAGILRISLQDSRNGEMAAKSGASSKCSPYAEAYHAGMPAARRKVVQKSFMSGKTRIVVATVAFGMGINKSNIRSVIHYNMPGSFEGYVQEVGRAGRDNLPAHCHLFLSPSQGADKLELRRHIYANSVDRHTIRRLLGKIFLRCSCRRSELPENSREDGGSIENKQRRCPGHEVAIPIDETVRALDISEETMSTLLCYLELHPKRFVTVLSSVYVRAVVSSYAGPGALKVAAQTSPPLAMAIALDSKKGICHDRSTVVEFPVVDVAAAIGWDSGVVKNHLKQLEWETVAGSSMAKRSAITVKFDTLGLRVRAPGDLTDAELDEALEVLADRAQSQENSALHQLEVIHASLEKFSLKCVQQCMKLDDEVSSRSESLKQTIRQYFDSDAPQPTIESLPLPAPQENGGSKEAEITSDVRGLISSYRETNFTGRAVARIFYGIQSPNFSALTWSRCRFWRCHLSSDFNLICRIANREILAMR